MTVSKLTESTVAPAAALTKNLFPAECWSEQDLRASMGEENRTFFAAVSGGQVAGCGGVQIAGEQGDILTVGVDPSFRRQGLGEALLTAMIAEFKGWGGKQLFLEVRASNLPARALYEKCGFLEISRRKGYYRDPLEDAIIYMFEVNP